MNRYFVAALRRPTTVTIVTVVTFLISLFFYLPVFALYLQSHGLSIFQVNALQTILVTVSFVAEVPTGILADRFGHKRAWLAALILQLIAEILFLTARNFWAFALCQLITGVGFAFASGALESLIYDSLDEKNRDIAMKRALGQIAAAMRMGNLFAFLASGILTSNLQPGSFELAIKLTIVSISIGCLVAFFVRDSEKKPVGEHHSSLTVLYSGIATIRHNPRLIRMILLAVLTNSFGFFLIVLYQPYFVRAGVPGYWFGPTLAVGSLLSALCERYAYVLEERLGGVRRGMLLGTLLPGLFYLLMAPVKNPILAVLLICLQYGTMHAVRPLLQTYMNGHIRSEHRATTLSLISLSNSLYEAIIGLVFGYVADYSITTLFVLMGSIIVSSALLFRINESHLSTTDKV